MLCQIIPEKCIACGLCQVYAPNIFDYTDDGIIIFKNDPSEKKISVPSAEEKAVKKAYQKCPSKAIQLEH